MQPTANTNARITGAIGAAETRRQRGPNTGAFFKRHGLDCSVTAVVRPEVYAWLNAFAKAGKKSNAQVLRELIHDRMDAEQCVTLQK